MDEFVLQVFEILVVQIEPAFERSVRDTLFPLEQDEDLGEHFIEGHRRPSASHKSVSGMEGALSLGHTCSRNRPKKKGRFPLPPAGGTGATAPVSGNFLARGCSGGGPKTAPVAPVAPVTGSGET